MIDGAATTNGAAKAIIGKAAGLIGFNGATPVAKPTITGAKGGNLALGSLLSAMAAYGLIVDMTTA